METFKTHLLLGLLIPYYTQAQPTLLGYTGLINTPTAEISEDGDLWLSTGYTPRKFAVLEPGTNGEIGNVVNITFLPFVELCVGNTLPMNSGGAWGIGDRKMTARVRIFQEKKYRPALLFGFHDPVNGQQLVHGIGGNSQYFTANYVAMTKRFEIPKDWRLAMHLAYGWGDNIIGNRLLRGAFGGMSIQRNERMAWMLEYDGARINGGIRFIILQRISVVCTLLGMSRPAAGLSYKIQL